MPDRWKSQLWFHDLFKYSRSVLSKRVLSAGFFLEKIILAPVGEHKQGGKMGGRDPVSRPLQYIARWRLMSSFWQSWKRKKILEPFLRDPMLERLTADGWEMRTIWLQVLDFWLRGRCRWWCCIHIFIWPIFFEFLLQAWHCSRHRKIWQWTGSLLRRGA